MIKEKKFRPNCGRCEHLRNNRPQEEDVVCMLLNKVVNGERHAGQQSPIWCPLRENSNGDSTRC